jgi:hypothetical protein
MNDNSVSDNWTSWNTEWRLTFRLSCPSWRRIERPSPVRRRHFNLWQFNNKHSSSSRGCDAEPRAGRRSALRRWRLQRERPSAKTKCRNTKRHNTKCRIVRLHNQPTYHRYLPKHYFFISPKAEICYVWIKLDHEPCLSLSLNVADKIWMLKNSLNYKLTYIEQKLMNIFDDVVWNEHRCRNHRASLNTFPSKIVLLCDSWKLISQQINIF